MRAYIFLIVITMLSAVSLKANENVDSNIYFNSDIHIDTNAPKPVNVPIKPLVKTPEQRWWLNLLKQGKLSMTDTTVIYPRFIKFCVDVYNWGDHLFNSYDPEYVVGTGKRWKARIVSDNWVDSYAMTLPRGLHTWMLSDLYSNRDW